MLGLNLNRPARSGAKARKTATEVVEYEFDEEVVDKLKKSLPSFCWKSLATSALRCVYEIERARRATLVARGEEVVSIRRNSKKRAKPSLKLKVEASAAEAFNSLVEEEDRQSYASDALARMLKDELARRAVRKK